MQSKMIVGVIAAVLIVGGGIVIYSSYQKDPDSYTNTANANVANTNTDRVEADGTIVKPDGTMIKIDGTMVKPDGTVVKPDGTMIKTDGTMIGPDGTVITETTNTNSAAKNTNAAANTNTTSVNTNVSAATPAVIVDYSVAALATAQAGTGDVVIYFHANWCPICRALEPDIRKNLSNLPKGLTILKADYDQETALKKQYGVTYQTAFVQVDDSGIKLKLWIGTTSALDIADQLI